MTDVRYAIHSVLTRTASTPGTVFEAHTPACMEQLGLPPTGDTTSAYDIGTPELRTDILALAARHGLPDDCYIGRCLRGRPDACGAVWECVDDAGTLLLTDTYPPPVRSTRRW